MKVTAVKTQKVMVGDNLLEVLDKHLSTITERSVLAVTSKIVAICEGSVVKQSEITKDELIKLQADKFIPPEASKYHITLTIKNDMLIPSAGIDESNSNGYFILWPKDAFKSANEIRLHLRTKYNLKNIGVIITDSTTSPLRWGVTGKTIAFSGFNPLNNYIGTKDIFGHELRVTKTSVIDGLAASAVLVMGEGSEQTPLAVIEDLPFVQFQDQDPTDQEIENLKISIEDDLYAPLITNAPWKTRE